MGIEVHSVKPIVKLEKWIPVLNDTVLLGHAYGHPDFPDGFHIKTSRILGKKEGLLVSYHHRYDLGEPQPHLNTYTREELLELFGELA